MSSPDASAVLIGDIGGTNIRLVLVPDALCGSRPRPLHSVRYQTAEFAHLRDALARFVAELPAGLARVTAAALSVCGPVVEGSAICMAESMGASGWRLDEADLASSLGVGPCGYSTALSRSAWRSQPFRRPSA